jgi:hypothetical protein
MRAFTQDVVATDGSFAREARNVCFTSLPGVVAIVLDK